jgi:ABC-type Mn2+/Zn2+ transport system permease subunit
VWGWLDDLPARIACAVIGVFVVLMHMPFIGVAMSHAAFAGALLGLWLGFDPLIGAFALSLLAAAVIGPLADRGELSPETSLGVIFSLTVTASLRSIGGLLIFSLIMNPAAAAYQLTYSMKKMFLLSALFGVLSGWTGLAFSYFFDLPSGATIVVTSSVIFMLCALFSPKRRVMRLLKKEREARGELPGTDGMESNQAGLR